MNEVYRYSGFGLCIESELEMRGLPPGIGVPDVLIRLGSVTGPPHARSVDDEVAVSLTGGAFQVRRGKEIIVDPRPDSDPRAVRAMLMGRVMAFLMRQRGWLPLHASAVVIGEQAVAFLGASGAGKSTTAAAFHKRGHLVITDDVSATRVESGECLVRPGWPMLRLGDDSGVLLKGLDLTSEFQTDKFLWNLKTGGLRGSYPVRRIYCLEYGDQLHSERVTGPFKAAVLSQNSFVRAHRQGPEAMRLHLKDCADIASATDVYRLRRPKDLSSLDALVNAVERELA